MPKRVSVSPAERLRAEIDKVFAGGEDLSRAIERIAQLRAQLLLQSALEAEVTAFLSRDRYERAAAAKIRGRDARRVPPDHGENDRKPDHTGPAEAAQHH